MYIALLLLTHVQGEWVEISQQHYVKPLRNGFIKHPPQSQKPNRIYLNDSLPNYNWEADVFGGGKKVIGDFKDSFSDEDQSKHFGKDEWKQTKSVLKASAEIDGGIKKGNIRRVYISSTEESKVPFKDESLEVLNLSDLEYSTEDSRPIIETDIDISHSHTNQWFTKHVAAKIPAVKFQDTKVETQLKFEEAERNNNVVQILPKGSNVSKDVIPKNILLESMNSNKKTTHKPLDSDLSDGKRNKIIVMTTKNPPISSTVKSENFVHSVSNKGDHSRNEIGKKPLERNSILVTEKTEVKGTSPFVSKVNNEESNVQESYTIRPIEMSQTTKPVRQAYEPIPRPPVPNPEDVMMEELLKSEGGNNASIPDVREITSKPRNTVNTHAKLKGDKNNAQISRLNPTIKKENVVNVHGTRFENEDDINMSLNNKQPLQNKQETTQGNKIKVVIKSTPSSVEHVSVNTEDTISSKDIMTAKKSNKKQKIEFSSEVNPFTESMLSEVRMVTSKETFKSKRPNMDGSKYSVYPDETSKEQLSKYEEIDLNERIYHPIRGIITKVVVPKSNKVSGEVNNRYENIDQAASNKHSNAKRPFEELHSIHTDAASLEKEHRHINVENNIQSPIHYSSTTEKYSNIPAETLRPSTDTTEAYERTHYDPVKVLLKPKPGFITKEVLQNGGEPRNNFVTVAKNNASDGKYDANDTPIEICEENSSSVEGDCRKPTTPTDNEEEKTDPDDKTKAHAMENLLKYLKVVTDTISRNSRRNFKGKVRYLENLKNSIWSSIEERIEAVFPDEAAPVRRQHRSAEARGHVEFPSSESALMTISFLTFAVYLIKLVLQVIQAYKNKTMMVPAVVATVGRAYQHSRSSRHH